MRFNSFVSRFKEEDGQAIILVALAMGIFLLGAIGLAVDGSILYTQRQMAQAAADAAAQAGIMSIFDGTNGAGTAQFVATPGTSFVCTTTDAETPCVYARHNGFGGAAGDTVTVSFPTPPATAAPGVALSGSAPTNLIKVSVSRDVPTTLMRFLGSTVTTMRATAMAAIVDVVAPVPILVTHPTLTQSLFLQGNPAITICGGPARSIQVNSSDPNAFHNKGSATVDLSKAGPLDDGKCNTGTGADFGTWGGPPLASIPKGVTLGVGKYIEPSSPIKDPLAGVAPPDPKSFPTPPTTIPLLGDGASGCPSPSKKPCHLYSPGIYPVGINGDNTTPVFSPGIYYIRGGGITCHNNCEMFMATGFTDGSSGTNTGWTGNVLFYNTGTTGSPTNSGSIVIDANGTTNLVGSCSGPPCVGDASYKGILFFEDRAADAQTHSLGGGGAMTLVGTIYMTNTLATMTTTPAHFQGLNLGGGSGSGTLVQGEIIVGTLTMTGNGAITMDLNPNASLVVQQVALVN
jgi:Flp pilus assembly protein TadG